MYVRAGCVMCQVYSHELWLQGSCGLDFPGEAVNMNKALEKVEGDLAGTKDKVY